MGRVFICTDRGPSVPDDSDCPNNDNHQPHPRGYVANSNWADDALLVADPQQCPNCQLWKIWVPKSRDLRIVKDWPAGVCDWGRCEGEGVGERFHPEHGWLPVCAAHTGVTS